MDRTGIGHTGQPISSLELSVQQQYSPAPRVVVNFCSHEDNLPALLTTPYALYYVYPCEFGKQNKEWQSN